MATLELGCGALSWLLLPSSAPSSPPGPGTASGSDTPAQIGFLSAEIQTLMLRGLAFASFLSAGSSSPRSLSPQPGYLPPHNSWGSVELYPWASYTNGYCSIFCLPARIRRNLRQLRPLGRAGVVTISTLASSCDPVEMPELPLELDPTLMPRHVAIIMDGNSRWAEKRGWPASVGHEAGVRSLREVVKLSQQWGIQVLTVFAFSTENWLRPKVGHVKPANKRACTGFGV